MNEPDDAVKRVMHITFHDEAPDDEIERAEEIVTNAVWGMERGKWDAFITSHAGDCGRDAFCAGDAMEQAWDEGWTAGDEHGGDHGTRGRNSNPYRSAPRERSEQ